MKRMSRILLATISCVIMLMAFVDQNDFSQVLQQKLDRYYKRHVPLKIHLLFHQPKYIAGDTAFYKIDFFTADDLRPIGGRQLLTVELRNPAGALVYQTQVLVKDGTGVNQIPLDENSEPGIYTVVAYHAVMTDDDPNLYFQCPLHIAGPYVMERRIATKAFSFFPEGGHLIAGITNKVVVTGPSNVSVSLFSESEAEIVSFDMDDDGLGVFFITPVQEGKYFIRINGQREKIDLPLPEADGAGLLVAIPVNQSPLRVTIQIPDNSALKSEDLQVVMTMHARVLYAAALSFKDRNNITFSLPQDNLPEGPARLTVFKTDGTPYTERLLYIKGPASASAVIRLTDESFRVRDIISVAVSLNSGKGDPLSSKFSARVFRDDILTSDKSASGNLRDNAIMLGDLKGSLNNVVPYQRESAEDLLRLDHYLITQKWRRFTWKDVWEEKLPSIAFSEYLHLKGRAFNSDGTSLPDSTMITFFLQKSVMTYEAYARAAGDFEFPLLMDYYGEEEIFYRAESRGIFLPNVQVKLDSAFATLSPPPLYTTSDVRDAFYSDAVSRRNIQRSYAFHMTGPAHVRPPSLNALIEEEVFGADVIVNFDDYLLFPTMSETLREIVPMLQHRKRASRDVVRLYFDDRDRFAEDEPLFIIDGVISDNTTYFLSLNPADVVSVRVINSFDKLNTFGSLGRNGMVLVETKIPDNADRVPRSIYTFHSKGLTAPAQGALGNRSVRHQPQVPDLRTSLYWNPELKTDATGEAVFSFPASDVPGDYRIEIEGFTEEGEPFFTKETFRVSYSHD